MESCLVKASSKIPALLSKASPEATVQSFAAVKERLAWHNSLGLALPESGEEAKKLWGRFWALELDWGPTRSSRRGNPSIERISNNFYDHIPQYAHLVLL